VRDVGEARPLSREVQLLDGPRDRAGSAVDDAVEVGEQQLPALDRRRSERGALPPEQRHYDRSSALSGRSASPMPASASSSATSAAISSSASGALSTSSSPAGAAASPMAGSASGSGSGEATASSS